MTTHTTRIAANADTAEEEALETTSVVSLSEKLSQIIDTAPENVWEQWPGETDMQFERFCAYRDAPPSKRSIDRLATELNIHRSQLYGLSTKWKWKSRVLAWDKHRDKVRCTAELSEIALMRRRHVAMARDMQDIVQGWMSEKLEERENGVPVKLTPREAVSMMESGVKLEANSIDTDAADDTDLGVLTSDELIQYTSLRRKILAGTTTNHDDN